MDDVTTLERWYESLDLSASYARQCKMRFPDGIVEHGDLRGKRVLDMNCRRGKGANKLSALVGAGGYVLGTDPSPDNIAAAQAHIPEALARNGIPQDEGNLAFAVAYPERLEDVVQADAWDVVYLNSSFVLCLDVREALYQVHRALRDGGLLLYDAVFADGERDPEVMQKARRLGNVVQAAPFVDSFLFELKLDGFSDITLQERCEVAPSEGANADVAPNVVSTDEQITFHSVLLSARTA